jgi:hypothetical protein
LSTQLTPHEKHDFFNHSSTTLMTHDKHDFF